MHGECCGGTDINILLLWLLSLRQDSGHLKKSHHNQLHLLSVL